MKGKICKTSELRIVRIKNRTSLITKEICLQNFNYAYLIFGSTIMQISDIHCPPPSIIDNAVMNSTDTALGTAVKYTLMPGYHIDGMRSLVSMCTSDRIWHPQYHTTPNRKSSLQNMYMSFHQLNVINER